MRLGVLVVIAVIAVMAACGDGGGGGSADAGTIDGPACVPSGTAQTVHLSFVGATYMPGSEDAVANTSAVLDMTRTIPAWPHANTQAIKDCITAGLAPFNLDVVDAEPSGVHHEIVFTTALWGSNSTPRSISAFNCGAPSPKSVTFVFGTPTGDNADDACNAAISQFASASASLDHSMDCHDYLGRYQPACGPPSFLDMPVACGETTARDCTCSMMPQQNSFERMVAVHGRRCP